MEDLKNYKQYFIDNETWRIKNKIQKLKEYCKMNKEEMQKECEYKWHLAQYLTGAQYKYFLEGNKKQFLKLVKKQLQKESIKLEEAKKEAIQKYNEIAALKDIKRVVIEVEWSTRRMDLGAYQTRAAAQVWYKDGSYKSTLSSFTGGCGYDKPSTSLSNVCNELLKIIPLKHYKKILSDPDKHHKFYALEPLYFQYGVGVSSYQTLFKNLGYKTQFLYHKNENITIIIDK